VTRRSSLPLQLKLTAALVLIVITPLAASSYLVDQLGRAAANVASSEAESRLRAMEATLTGYRRMVDYTVEVTFRMQTEIAQRLALRKDLRTLDAKADLAQVLAEDTSLRAVALVRGDGTLAASAKRAPSQPTWLDKIVDQPLDDDGALLRLTFQVPPVADDMASQLAAIRAARTFMTIRATLADSYRTAFLVLLGVAGLAAAGFGYWASSFVTRRITALVSTARKVSDGQLAARVELRGQDELAELGRAFNTMLDDLDQARAQLQYLQRMGVWQDVARRLAHEIKNPLTPIQLAVQQCVSSYGGDDGRYRKLLADTGEIVEEEIAALRRLVDTFRTLGALPKVEKAPIALAEVIDELTLDPTMAARLALQPPDQPVTVRADKLLLKRVLANLVENAIHAGQEAGQAGDVAIGWTADPARDMVTITVDDHGKGVPEASRESIFEPYVTTKATGTGLGLSIARKLAIEHGGDVVLAPERAPTGGARFVVTLPLRGPESATL
jgi:nitrogen fixation/metabolism regulation signal transduction histidine kinase